MKKTFTNFKTKRIGKTAKYLIGIMLLLFTTNTFSQTWSGTGSMVNPRSYATATLLLNGKVLVTGGSGNGILNTCELYDPSTGIWSSTGAMASPRSRHTTTLLSNGKVLVTGGANSSSSLNSCELYDPATETWSSTGSMASARRIHTATVLLNGKVLVIAGISNSGGISSCELYDPATGTWSNTASISSIRAAHAAVLLSNGKVLLTGGTNGVTTNSCELYDPAAETWSNTGSMASARRYHTATILSNGKVLVIGGFNASPLSSCELYDPATGMWSNTASMASVRYAHTSSLLDNGKILVTGGLETGNSILFSCEIYDPTLNGWSNTGSLGTGRNFHTASLLSNGKVLITGGVNGSNTPLSSSELYTPAVCIVSIPDTHFKTWILANISHPTSPTDITCAEAAAFTGTINVANLGITDLTGIESFINIDNLNCSNNSLNSLPSLLNSVLLNSINCSSNQLINITDLPPAITSLFASYNQLTTLPTLPNTLEILGCDNNQLTSLPALPSVLTNLNCFVNHLGSLPALPNTLTNLSCYNDELTSLPTLPASLNYLNCDANNFTSLPALPGALIQLNCNYNQLSSLPALPNSLEELVVGYNHLTNCPTLPNSLRTLAINDNLFTSMPALPNSLINFGCSSNHLTTLGTLPPSLQSLSCVANNITNLPILPSSLLSLECGYNQLTNLPVLPGTLNRLHCEHNNIHCFPNLPNTLAIPDYLIISNNPFTCLPNYVPAMDAATLALPLCGVGNPNGCPGANGIAGTTYKETGTNSAFDAGVDIALPNIPLTLTGAATGQTITASNGVYSFAEPAGTYSVKVETTGMPYSVQSTNPETAVVTTGVTIKDFAINCTSGFDVGTNSIVEEGIVFPGQPHQLKFVTGDLSKWYGLNCASGISGTVVISVTGPVVITNVIPGTNALTPTSASSTAYSYTIPDFGIGNVSTDYGLVLTPLNTATTGDIIHIHVAVTPSAGDNNTANNSFDYSYPVVNSYDPNFKEVYPAADVPVGYTDYFTYTVHFQNDGTANAMNIKLTDTLDANLDLSTFQVINYSHPVTSMLTGNQLIFNFNNINLGQSSVDLASSQGYVQYRIKPLAGLAAGTQIHNIASIYFDFNPAVITNTTTNTYVVPTVYCTPITVITYQGQSSQYVITNVSIGSINNTTGNETNYYGNYAAQSTAVSVGSTQSIAVTCASYYARKAVFIDYNDDGDFADVGEDVVPSSQFSINYFTIPLNAPLGAHRMRIISNQINTSNPCSTNYGETEDYTINVICPSLMYSDNDIDGYGAGTGIPATCPIPAGYSVFNTDCNDANASIHPGAIEIAGNSIDDNCDGRTDELVYCAPANTENAFGSTIRNVKIGTIDNSTVFQDNYWGDFTSQSTNVYSGSIQSIYIQAYLYWAAYIDYNDDGDFTDAGENIVPSTSLFSTYSFIVKPTASIGPHRLRVIADNYGISGPCSSLNGEAEDYTINILCPPLMYADNDNDGYGTGIGVGATCPFPPNFTGNNADCYDNNSSAYPGAVEITGNNIDENCNGVTDERTYCTPINTSHYQFEAITNVHIGSINNTTTNETNFYGSYITQSTTAALGSIQTITVSTQYNRSVAVFIDYNNDGDFNDTGENVVPSNYTPITLNFKIPLTATIGAIRMRVVASNYGGNPTPCTNSLGETEDYTIIIVCPALMYADNDTDGYGAGTGITAVCPIPAGFSFNNLDCNDDNSAIHPGATEIQGNGIDENCNGIVDELTNCIPIRVGSYVYGVINNVSIGTINNPTINETNFYGDYTAQLTTAVTGSTQTITVAISNSSLVAVYIDYNNDGDFTDAGENVVSYIYGSQTNNFIIPANATLGALRMRVITDAIPITDPCVYTYGEAEDYTIYITNTPCIAPEIPTVVASSLTKCGTEIVTLTVASGNINDATHWQWYSGSCNGTSVGSGSSINVSSATTTTYFARGMGGCITPGSCSSPITITVINPTLWYQDTDNDDFGDPAVSLSACTQPTGYVADNTDNCVSLFGKIGSACDDGNGNTTADVINGSCTCAGTSILSITTSAVSTNLCPGTSGVGVPFTITGTYNAANVFTAQLSDATGSFTSPVTIDITPPITYAGTMSAVIPSNTPSGTGYRIRVISSNPAVIGTDNGSDITISAVTVNATVLPATPVCAGSPITLSATGASSYEWCGGNITCGSNSGVTTATATTTYTVTGNTNGCTNSTTITVTVNPLPTVTISTGATSFCAGASTQLCAPSGLNSYLWSTGASTQCITVSTAGTYTVTATNANGCASTATQTVTATPLPTVTITGTPSFCTGASTQLCAPSGLSSYLWSTGASTQCITVSTAGTYTVTATNANGCASTATQTVTVTPLPTVVVTVSPSSTVCAGTPVTLNATGATSYLFSSGIGGITNGVPFTPLVTITYTVTGTSGTCSGTTTQTITVTPAPVCQNGGTVNASCGCNCPSGFTGALCQTAVCIVYIPDIAFKTWILANIPHTTSPTDITCAEAAAFTGTISVAGLGIANLTGIEAFTAITGLDCSDNSLLDLNVSANTALTYLRCDENQLTSLDVSANTALISLICSYNNLISLNVSSNSALVYLYCEFNKLTSLYVSANAALTDLGCRRNQITSLDVSDNAALINFDCSDNQLTNLSVSANTALVDLNCANNQIVSLNVSANIALVNFRCDENELTSLNIQNGNNSHIAFFDAIENFSLYCIQVDNASYMNNLWFPNKDAWASYSINCSAITWYLDADHDGYYVSSQVAATSPGAGYTATLPVGGLGDCDDTNPAIHAGIMINTQPINSSICITTGAISLTASASSSASLTYQWQVLSPLVGAVWTNVINSTAVYAGATTAALVIHGATAAMSGSQYKVRINGIGACEAISNAAVLTVIPKPIAGTITASSTICSGSNKIITLGSTTVGTIQWQSSVVSGTAGFSDIAGAISNTLDTGALTATTYFRAVVSNGICSPVNSLVCNVTVSFPTNAGIITGGGVTVCKYSAATASSLEVDNYTILTLSGYGGASPPTLQWRKWTILNGTYVYINGGSSIAATNLTVTTYFQAIVTSGYCTAYSAPVVINVDPTSASGSIAALPSGTICYNTGKTLTLSNSVGNIQWQSATAVGGPFIDIASANSNTLDTGNLTATTYYQAVVTSGVCSSKTTAVTTVTVSPQAVGTIAQSNTSVCYQANGTLLTLSGLSGTIQWQSSSDASFATFTVLPSTATTYTAMNLSSTTYYRAVVVTSCATINSAVCTITVRPQEATGTIFGGGVTVCKYTAATATAAAVTNSTNLTLSGYGAGTTAVQWIKYTATTNGVFISGATSPTVTIGNLTVTTYFQVMVTTNGCISYSAPATIFVDPTPTSVAGTITASVTGTICYNTGKTLTLSNSVGNIQWQSATAVGGPFIDIAGANSNTLDTGNLTATTYYQAVVTSGVCSSKTTAVATVTVYPQPVGTITPSNATVCYGTNSTVLTLSGLTGTIQWQSSTDSSFATYTVLASTATTYTAVNLTATTYYRAVVVTSCSTINSAVCTIIVGPQMFAGTISGGGFGVCQYTAATATSAEVTNYTALYVSGTGGGSSQFYYQWQKSSALNGQYSNISGATWSSFGATNLTVTTYYQVVVTSGGCSVVTAPVVINVGLTPVAGTIAAFPLGTICSGSGKTLTVSGNVGYPNWESATAVGGPFTSIPGTTVNTLDTGNLTATTYYRLFVTNDGCTYKTTAVTTVTVSPQPVGTIAQSNTTVCYGTNSTILTLSGLTGSIEWQSSADNTFATFNVLPSTATTYTATDLTITTYFRAVVITSCATITSAVCTLTVSPPANAGTILGGNVSVCKYTAATASSPVVHNSTTLNLLGYNSGSTFQWQKSSSLAGPYTYISLATLPFFTAIDLTVTTFYRAVVKSGACSANSAAVAITVVPIPVAGAITASAHICLGSNKLISLGSTTVGTIQWQSSIVSATAGFTDIIAATSNTFNTGLLTTTTYYRAVVGNGICSVNSLVCTVTVDPPVNPGTIFGGDITVCKYTAATATTSAITNSTSLHLSNYMGGNIPPTFQWRYWAAPSGSPVNIVGATSATYIAVNLTVSTYFQLIITAGACTYNSVPVLITVAPIPVAGTITASATICSGGNKIITLGTTTVGNIQWQSSTTSSTTGFSDITGATNNPLDTGALTATTYFRAVVGGGACSPVNTSVCTVTVSPPINPGTILGGNITICKYSNATTNYPQVTNSIYLSLSGNSGGSSPPTYQWQIAPSLNTLYFNISGATSSTYAASNLTATAYYQLVIKSGGCSAISGPVAIIVDPTSTSGTISALPSGTICYNTGKTLTLSSTHVGNVQWQSSAASGGPWADIAGANSNTLNTGNLTATTYYQAVVTSGVCSSKTTSVTTVAVSPPASATVTASNAVVCAGTNSTLLTLSGPTGTIEWQSSAYSSFSTYTVLPGTATTYTATNLTATTYYRAVVVTSCGSVNSSVRTITVSPPATGQLSIGGISASATVCKASALTTTSPAVTNSTTLTIINYSGNTVIWKKSPSIFGPWSPITGATAASYTAVNLTATTFYQAVVISGACSVGTNFAGIFVDPTSASGSISASPSGTLCYNTGKTLTLSNSVGNIQWQSAANVGGPFTDIAGANSNTLATGNLMATTYYQAVVTSGVCSSKTTAVATVTVSPQQIGTITQNNNWSCAPSTGTNTCTHLVLSGVTGTIQWQSSTDINFSTYNILVGTGTTYIVSNLAVTTYFRAVVITSCGTVYSSVCTVTFLPPALAGTILGGDVTVCKYTAATATAAAVTNSTILNLSGLGGNLFYQYIMQKSTNLNGPYVNITADINIAGLATYTVSNLTATTYYRAIIISHSPVYTAISTPVVITVSPTSAAGTISALPLGAVCYNTGKTLTLSGNVGTVQWQSAGSLTGPFVDIAGANSNTLNTGNLTATTYYQAVVTSGVCSSKTTAVTMVLVNAQAVGGSLAQSNTKVCYGINSTVLSLSGQIGIVQWQSSADINFGTYSVLSGTSATRTVSNLTAITYFRAAVRNGICSPVFSNTVGIGVTNPVITGTISGTADVCSGSATTLTVLGYAAGSSIQWQKCSTLTGTYTPVTAGSGMATNVYTTPALTATTYFRALVSYNGCSAATPGYVVAQKVIAGTITGGTVAPGTVCMGTPVTLTLTAYAGTALQWKASATNNGNFIDVPGATSSTYIANTTFGSVYYKVLVSYPGCTSLLTAPVLVAAINCPGKEVILGSTPYQFEVKAYPNPFGRNFTLNLTTSSDERVELRVYDMIGRMIEVHQVNVTELSTQEVGNNYPSGIYNLVVSQGKNVKTLRVVKR